MAKRIIERLTARGETVACAESLTGGLLCDALVQIPGASKAFLGGVVAYDEGQKVRLLGVDAQTLAQKSAVSAEVALQMAQGVREKMGATYGISTTGYAGPEGARVGLVYVAYADAAGAQVRACQFTGARGEIRAQAVQAALQLFNEHID